MLCDSSVEEADVPATHLRPVDFMVMEPSSHVLAAVNTSVELHSYLCNVPWASSPQLVRAVAAVLEYLSVETLEQVRLHRQRHHN